MAVNENRALRITISWRKPFIYVKASQKHVFKARQVKSNIQK